MPERLNLSIGHRCWVSCAGCYSFFGNGPARLSDVLAVVDRFVALGVDKVTVSGGDPLRVEGLQGFLDELRGIGVRSIKLDTVGTSIIGSAVGVVSAKPGPLLRRLDVLALPLDGWSPQSVGWFRAGRPRLFEETCELLGLLDEHVERPAVYVNTVLHARNVEGLDEIERILRPHLCVTHWNVFQYTATDQAASGANESLALGSRRFAAVRAAWAARKVVPSFEVEFASSEDRLGRYLLINSDGEAWLPDASGRTIRLGPVRGREAGVLAEWQRQIQRMRPPRERAGVRAQARAGVVGSV